MTSIRPFKFVGLPKLSREQVAWRESLTTYFTQRPFTPEFREQLQTMLSQELKSQVQLGESTLKSATRAEIASFLPKHACVVVLNLAPANQKLLVEIDPQLAALSIERLLGGQAPSAKLQRALTEIEEGVLSYIVLQIISQFHQGWVGGKELGLSFDRFAGQLSDLQSVIDAENDFQVMTVQVGFDQQLGYVRLLFPQSLIQQRFGASVPQSGATALELDYMRQGLNALGETSVVARVQAANIDISAEDVSRLEAGDIIVLENHELALSPSGITGRVFVKIGDGNNGGLRGILQNEGEQCQLQISEFVIAEQPPEVSMVIDDQEEVTRDNLPQTEGLLRDVDASIAVELGRIRLNTAQVVRLRAGQVLRLPRGPNDPVDLVVNGKLYARGELIEIDGELGVRLLQVVAAG